MSHPFPYSRISRPPVQSGTRLSADRTNMLLQSLMEANRSGIMLTFNLEFGDWEAWERPQRIVGGDPVDVAASGIRKLGVQGPLCPHGVEMKIGLNQPYYHERRDMYRPPNQHQKCPFYVIIPKIGNTHYLLSYEDKAEWRASIAANGEEIQPKDLLPDLSSFQDKANRRGSGLNNCRTTPDACAPAIRALGEGLDQHDIEPSQPSQHVQVTRASPVPNPRVTIVSATAGSPTRRTPGSTFTPFFNEVVAAARAKNDSDLIHDVIAKEKYAVFTRSPRSHPAADLLNSPRILQPYDQKIYPNCLNRSSQNLQHLENGVGRLMGEMSSGIGILREGLNVIQLEAQTCSSCKCVFNIDGFNSHRVQGRCGNCSNEKSVKPAFVDPDSEPEIHLRKFPPGHQPLHVPEYLDTPISVALLEWNSRIGVPQDVWAVVSTAYILCRSCRLVRTFNAHVGHLGEKGECTDPGQGQGAVVRADEDSD